MVNREVVREVEPDKPHFKGATAYEREFITNLARIFVESVIREVDDELENTDVKYISHKS